MQRSEAVRLILNQVISGKHYSYFAHTPSGYARIVESHRKWHARLHTAFNSTSHRYLDRAFPNQMGLWLHSGPKVLKVAWNEDTIKIINMRRGDWEADYFELPAFEGRSKLQFWELQGRGRSRRF